MLLYSVIVTYNPNIENLHRLINVLIKNNIFTIVIDNGSNNYEDIIIMDSSCNVIKLKENLGIAKAQNIGIRHVINQQADGIIFFDQDSLINEDFISNISCDFLNIQKNGINIAAIGPQFIDKKLGFYAPGLILNKFGMIKKIDISKIYEPKEVSVIISSGSLVSVQALRDVGLMNEDLFIDYVDTDWCFRALSKGYKIFVSNNSSMLHSVGEATIKIGKITCPVHSPFRRYYRVRNLFLLSNETYISKLWVVNMFFNNIIATFLLILTQKHKKDYVKYFSLAVKDGLKNKGGSL